jgi:MFS family permease
MGTTTLKPETKIAGTRTPLPWRELSVVLLVQSTEAVCFQYLFPFVTFMVRGFGIPEEDVGFYSGWIASSFMVGQFFSSLFWGRMSDKIGIKPVLLIGLGATTITVFLFGLSSSLTWALSTRFIGGLFNGDDLPLTASTLRSLACSPPQPWQSPPQAVLFT